MGYVGIIIGYVESASEYIAFESILVCMRYTFDYKGCILVYVQTTLEYVKSTLVHIASSLGYVKYVGGTMVYVASASKYIVFESILVYFRIT